MMEPGFKIKSRVRRLLPQSPLQGNCYNNCCNTLLPLTSVSLNHAYLGRNVTGRYTTVFAGKNMSVTKNKKQKKKQKTKNSHLITKISFLIILQGINKVNFLFHLCRLISVLTLCFIFCLVSTLENDRDIFLSFQFSILQLLNAVAVFL